MRGACLFRWTRNPPPGCSSKEKCRLVCFSFVSAFTRHPFWYSSRSYSVITLEAFFFCCWLINKSEQKRKTAIPKFPPVPSKRVWKKRTARILRMGRRALTLCKRTASLPLDWMWVSGFLLMEAENCYWTRTVSAHAKIGWNFNAANESSQIPILNALTYQKNLVVIFFLFSHATLEIEFSCCFFYRCLSSIQPCDFVCSIRYSTRRVLIEFCLLSRRWNKGGKRVE